MKIPRFFVLLCSIAIALVYVLEVRRYGKMRMHDVMAGNNADPLAYRDTVPHSNVSRGAMKGVALRRNVTDVGSRGNVADVASRGNVAAVASRGNVADVASRGNVADVASRGTVADVASRGNVADVASRGTLADVASRGSVADVASRGTVADVASRGSVADVASRGTVADVDSRWNVADVASRGNAAGVASRGNVADVASRGTVADVASRGNVAGVASRRNVADVASRGTVADVASRGNVAGVASRGNVAGVASRGTVADVASRGNVAGVASRGNVAGIASRGNVADVASRGNVAGVASRGNVADVASRGTVADVASRGNVAGVASRGNVAGVASRVNVADVASRGTVADVASRGNVAGVASRGNVAGVASRGSVTGNVGVSNHDLVRNGGIITWSPGSVGWAKLTDKCDVGKDFVLGHLQSPIDTPIYVYKEDIDEVVSGSIRKTGMWESELVEKLRRYLSTDPALVLLDIGANVGVFSLMAAKLGRTVFSIDCLAGNVHRLCASVSAGNLLKHVTIIHNAMSNTRENVTFGKYRGNVGATYVKKLDNSSTEYKDVVMSILLDDLLGIYAFKKVMIKIDVEAFEANVFRGGEKFFSKVQVDYLLMEFKYHRGRNSGQFVVDFLHRHNLVPMLKAGIDRKPSSPRGTIGWPEDVLWVRKELESQISL